MHKNSVLIIREQDEIVTACCIPFDGQFIQELGKEDLYIGLSETINSTGKLYKQLVEEFGDSINIDIVDSRNYAYIIPRIIKDAIRYRVPIVQASELLALKIPAIICNGRLIANGKDQLNNDLYAKITEIIGVEMSH